MQSSEFILAADIIYMCGHSLGPQPKTAKYKIEQTIKDWGDNAALAWNKSKWIDLSSEVAGKIAPLIGASENEVIICDSTSVNLYKVLMSALQLQNNRKIIVTTEDNFPADLYIAQGIQAFNNGIRLKTLKADALLENLDASVAVLMLTHVNYRDGAMHDMVQITKYAHDFGIVVIWDLSHSVGAVPVDLKACRADFAIGCTYKYLNGGPGSPAFVYVNSAHHSKIKSPIFGWMGHDQPFAFTDQYHATACANYYGGTPPILSLSALEGALSVFDDTQLRDLYVLSQERSLYLINALEELDLKILTPKNTPRGGHIAFIHPQGYALSRALIEQKVICDYRHPDLIRLCVNPLYLGIDEINRCIEIIRKILKEQLYRSAKYLQKTKVT